MDLSKTPQTKNIHIEGKSAANGKRSKRCCAIDAIIIKIVIVAVKVLFPHKVWKMLWLPRKPNDAVFELGKLDVVQSRANRSFQGSKSHPFFQFWTNGATKKTLITFQGILVGLQGSLCHGLWNNPCIPGQYFIPWFTLNNQGPFFHCSIFRVFPGSIKPCGSWIFRTTTKPSEEKSIWRIIFLRGFSTGHLITNPSNAPKKRSASKSTKHLHQVWFPPRLGGVI